MHTGFRASPALALAITALLTLTASAGRRPALQGEAPAFAWPAGARAADSLSFDDARPSQLDVGVPLFAERATHVTFYLTANNIGARAGDWKRAAAAGHELANHTATHPCSGNFRWSRSRLIEQATGVRPVTFAYPCGQKFVGRGAGVASYVPIVNELFLAGRGWLDEAANDPGYADRAQLFGYAMDDVEFSTLKPAVDDAIAGGQWLVLGGHDIGTEPGRQVTRVAMLRALIAYLREPSRRVWVDTVAQVAQHVKRAGPPK
jgi:peptidoglycan/xylan/chitin deacetylase (PgdA/CDA1 family)